MKVFLGAISAYLYNGLVSKVPSRRVRRSYLKVWAGALGKHSNVQMGCRFLNARRVNIGSHTVINYGCTLDGRKHNIVIGDNVSIGPEAALLSLGHDPQSESFEDCGGEVIVEDFAWVGYKAIILPGVKVGRGAVVGAGAVVTRDVEEYTVVAGNPACVIGKRNHDLSYELNFAPWLV